jgi:5-hydroxyisourate hydrolase-like protein (transthyretin family)
LGKTQQGLARNAEEAVSITDINLSKFLSQGMKNVDTMATNLDARMKEITASGEELKQEDLLMLQYEMGQYQAYMTVMNSTVQSVLGHMKELANSIR